MHNNDVARSLRFALNIPDLRVVELFALADYRIEKSELESIFSREGEAGYAECPDEIMERFLEGLIISRRGKKQEAAAPGAPSGRTGTSPARKPRLTNNGILRSIRIALQLKDEDIIGIMGLAGIAISKPQLSALFRRPGQPNYRPCGDQFLRNFLAGLTAKYRP